MKITIGENIKKLRESRKLKQEQLAETNFFYSSTVIYL